MRPIFLTLVGLFMAAVGVPQTAAAHEHGGFGVPLYNHPPTLVSWWERTHHVAPQPRVVAYRTWGSVRSGCSCCGCGSQWAYGGAAPVYGYRTYGHPHVWAHPAYGYARPAVRPRHVTHARIDHAPRYFPTHRQVAPLRAAPVTRERVVRTRATVERRPRPAPAAVSTRTLVRIR